jgi:hypothetical protein
MLRHSRGKGAVESGTIVFRREVDLHGPPVYMLQSHSSILNTSCSAM